MASKRHDPVDAGGLIEAEVAAGVPVDEEVHGVLRRVTADPDDVVRLRGVVGKGRTGRRERKDRGGHSDDSQLEQIGLLHWRSLRSVGRPNVVLMVGSLSLGLRSADR